MIFENIQEAFNHYRTATPEQIEQRAAQIKTQIATDANADVSALNIELDGLKEARSNMSNTQNQQTNWNPVTGTNFTAQATQQAAPADVYGTPEYRSAFFKRMLGQPLTAAENTAMQQADAAGAMEKRAAFINTSDAAAVIPTQTLNEIIRMATETPGILPLVRRFDVPANLAVPVATPEDAAEWHVQGAEVTPSNNTPTTVTFNAFELMKVFSLSAAARTMAIPAFETYLQEELGRTVVAALAKASVSGSGTGQPKGLLAAGVIPAAQVIDTPETGLTYKQFTDALGSLKGGYSAGAYWAMSTKTLYGTVAGIVDGNGRPLFAEALNGAVNGGFDRILGKPVQVDDYLPDGVILLGNFSYYGLNMPQNILVEVSRDSSFRKGLIDYRVLAIADGKPIVPEAFVQIAPAA